MTRSLLRTTVGRGAAGAAFVLGLSLALAGCSSSADEPPAGTPTGESPSGGADTTPDGDLSGELTVFAAASLQQVFDQLVAEFEAQNPGVTVDPVTYDGSSTLVTQLTEGASADVFASADQNNMAKAVDGGIVDGDPTVFTTNTLQIAVAPGNPEGISSLQDLADLAAGGGKVVLCAAEVPCGTASHTALDAAGVSLTPASEEQNVTAVLTKVASGEADAGLVYRTDVQGSDGAVEGVDFPEAAQAVNQYPIALLNQGARGADDDGSIGRAFIDLVLSDTGQQVLADAGFVAP